MSSKLKSILEELENLPLKKDKCNIVESRASHVIQSAVNLINFIRESYDQATAEELEKRLINSIRTQDPAKFVRGIRKTK